MSSIVVCVARNVEALLRYCNIEVSRIPFKVDMIFVLNENQTTVSILITELCALCPTLCSLVPVLAIFQMFDSGLPFEYETRTNFNLTHVFS